MSISRDRISWCKCWDNPQPHVSINGECILKRVERRRKEDMTRFLEEARE